jgi:predicted AlkP superfamily pyrophosphatase or phosphodiesterase
MAAPVLLIFIDSFPHYYLEKTKYLCEFETVAQVTPGFGYSVNCQAELFAGMSPDELGYFCEWTYDPVYSPTRTLKFIFHVLDPAKKIYYLDRLIHKGLQKIYADIKNIPFRYLSVMRKDGKSVFSEDFKSNSLVKLPGLKKILSLHYNHLHMEEIDLVVYKKAIKCLESNEFNSFLISFTKLDEIAHWHGVGSLRYDQKITCLDQWITDLRNKFLAKHRKGKVVVVSDHGMVNVKEGRRIELEKYFGEPSDKTYYYFLDGTISRIWTFESKVKKAMEDYLTNLKIGRIVPPLERKEYGIDSKRFGDIVFLIDEGLMFCPSFWGGKLSKAMHGYHPKLESQKGIFLLSEHEDSIANRMMRGTEVYNFLKEKIFY